MRAGPAAIAALLAACLLTAGIAAAVQPVASDGAVAQTSERSQAPDRLVAEGHDLGYEGTDVAEVTVLVNNTGGDLTADVRVALLTKNRTVLETKTTSPVLTSGANEVTIALDGAYALREFSLLRITIAESL